MPTPWQQCMLVLPCKFIPKASLFLTSVSKHTDKRTTLQCFPPSHLLIPWFLLVILDPENGSDAFLRSTSILSHFFWSAIPRFQIWNRRAISAEMVMRIVIFTIRITKIAWDSFCNRTSIKCPTWHYIHDNEIAQTANNSKDTSLNFPANEQ